MKLKICFVIDTLTTGGAIKLTLDVVDKLDKSFLDISLISLFEIDSKKSLEHLLPKGVYFECLKLRDKITLSNIFKLYWFLRPFETVHSTLELANFYCSVVSFLFLGRKRFISTIHGIDGIFIDDPVLQGMLLKHQSKRYRFLMKRFQNILFKTYSKFIAVSDATKNFLINQRGINPDKIKTIYHGIDLKHIDRKVSSSNLEVSFEDKLKGHFVIGYVGRFTHGKGVMELLSSFKKLQTEHPNMFLLMVGDGDFVNEIKNEIEISGLNSNCKLINFIENHFAYYRLMDILVLPSYSEGIPIVLEEAMYLETIVLATRVGGIPELISDKSEGFLFEKGDFVDMRHIIKYLYSENQPNLNRIRKNARDKIINKFDLDKNMIAVQNAILK